MQVKPFQDGAASSTRCVIPSKSPESLRGDLGRITRIQRVGISGLLLHRQIYPTLTHEGKGYPPLPLPQGEASTSERMFIKLT